VFYLNDTLNEALKIVNMIRVILINALVFLSMFGFVAAQSPDDNKAKNSSKNHRGDLKSSDSVRVTVNSTPQSAHLYVNGYYKGQTPVEMFLPPGNYRIYLRSSDEKSSLYAAQKIKDEQTLFYVLREFIERDSLKSQSRTYQASNYRKVTPYKRGLSNYQRQIKKEARQNDKNFERIIKAINQNNVKKINKLVSTNNNIELKGKQGETPLLYAIKMNRIEMVKVLVAAGANIHAIDYNGDGVLHYAIRYSNSNDLIFDFLDLGLELDRENKRGYTPMLFSIIFKSSDLTFLLIERGADVNKTTMTGENGLHLAIKSDSDTLFSFFISQKLNIEQVSHLGGTPLLLAMRNQNDQMVQEIIHAGAEIKSSYLDDAIWLDYKMVVEQILENGLSRPMNCSSNDACFKTAFTYSVFAGMADEDEQLQLYENALNIFKLANEKYRTDLGKIQAKEAAIATAIVVAAVITFGAIAESVPSSSSSYPTDYKSYQPSYSPPSSYDYSFNYGINSYQPKEHYPSKNNYEYKEKKFLKQQLKLCRVQIREIKKKISELKKNNKQL
jgi:ankyrin repeat protein